MANIILDIHGNYKSCNLCSREEYIDRIYMQIDLVLFNINSVNVAVMNATKLTH